MVSTHAGVNNLVIGPNATDDKYDTHTIRIDQTITSNNKFFASFSRGNRHEEGGLGGGRQAFIAEGHPYAAPTYNHWRINHLANFNLSSILSPTTVSTFRFGWNRHQAAIVQMSYGYDPTPLGFSQSLVDQAQNLGFPNVTVQ